MTKRKAQESTPVGFVPNTSVKVELTQSDLISVIMMDQIEIWEKELKEAEQKLSDFDSVFNPDKIFNDGIAKIVREKCGTFGAIEINNPGNTYVSFNRSNYPIQVSARQKMNGVEINIDYQIPNGMVKELMKEDLKLLKSKEEERVALVNDIVRIQDLIDNQSRFESKIRAGITRKILNEQGNGDLSQNLEAMRIAIFSDKKLLK
jgi:hypothetical protein